MVRDEDALRQRRPTWRIADPIVRFHHVVTRPDLARFEERRAAEAWADAQQRFSTHVLGPHFEDLARRWAARYASEATTGARLARVGATQVNDPRGRSQFELDVVGLAERGAISLIGEAKFAASPIGLQVLARLERARDLLAAKGWTAGMKLVVFSGAGFEGRLVKVACARDDVELVDLERLYTGD
ncbi:MAG: hypothetical protein ACYDH5_09670 [Acidimicrobiales bacterium]